MYSVNVTSILIIFLMFWKQFWRERGHKIFKKIFAITLEKCVFLHCMPFSFTTLLNKSATTLDSPQTQEALWDFVSPTIKLWINIKWTINCAEFLMVSGITRRTRENLQRGSPRYPSVIIFSATPSAFWDGNCCLD